MHFSALFVLLPLVHGAFTFDKGFEVSSLMAATSQVNGTYSANNTAITRIGFIFTDLNTNTSTNCSDIFTPSDVTSLTSVFGSYQSCSGDSNFGWKIGAFSGIENFELELQRRFSDPRYANNIPPLY